MLWTLVYVGHVLSRLQTQRQGTLAPGLPREAESGVPAALLQLSIGYFEHHIFLT